MDVLAECRKKARERTEKPVNRAAAVLVTETTFLVRDVFGEAWCVC